MFLWEQQPATCSQNNTPNFELDRKLSSKPPAATWRWRQCAFSSLPRHRSAVQNMAVGYPADCHVLQIHPIHKADGLWVAHQLVTGSPASRRNKSSPACLTSIVAAAYYAAHVSQDVTCWARVWLLHVSGALLLDNTMGCILIPVQLDALRK